MNKKEIKNLEEHVKAILPDSGEIPSVKGLDVFGESFQLNKYLGGDHIVYVDFKKRYDIDALIKKTSDGNKSDSEKAKIICNLKKTKSKAGILIADVSGHEKTDVVLTNGFHQAFLTAINYELRDSGDITLELFEILNTRFINSSSKSKYFTLIYGEFHESGKFRFLSAGHPLPLIYSYKKETLCSLHNSTYASSMPMSMFPSDDKNIVEFSRQKTDIINDFTTNKSQIPESGDIIILYSDGLSEHTNNKGDLYYEPSSGGRLQEIINTNKNLNAKKLFYKIKEDMLKFGKQEDDISFVIIKKK